MMRRKIQTISWLTAFFALTLLWALPAMAEDYKLKIAETQVTDANCNDLSGIKGVTVGAGGWFKYDPAAQTLTMKNVTITLGGYAILNEGVEGLKIVVSGTNRLETKSSSLKCYAPTELEGNGSLTVISGVAGIFLEAPLTISDITLEATGKWGIAGYQGLGKEELSIKNAKVTAIGRYAGIADLASFDNEGYTILIPAGGKFDETKHAVVDAEGNKAKMVKIASEIDEYDLHIAGVQVTDANCNDLSVITGVTVGEEGVFNYNPVSKTLTMEEVKVLVGDKDAIRNEIEGLKIDISGTNRVVATTWAALAITASTEIEGRGSLITASKKESGIGVYISSETTLTVSGITLEASGQLGITGSTTLKGKALILKNAMVTATGTEAGIANLASFTTEGCEIVEPADGKFDEEKHAVVDASGNKAKLVKIEPTKYPLLIGNTYVDTQNYRDLDKLACVKEGYIWYDHANKRLTLSGVTIEVGENEIPILNKGIDGLTIVVQWTNILKSKNSSGISSMCSMYINGYGSLSIESESGAALALDNTKDIQLNISHPDLSLSGKYGIQAGTGKVRVGVNDANISLKGSEAATHNLAALELSGVNIVTPAKGEFSATKKAIVDKDGNTAKEAGIAILYNLYIAGTQVNGINCKNLKNIEGVTVAEDGEFYYDPSWGTLVMNGVSVSVGDGISAFSNTGIENLTIVVKGVNRLETTTASSLDCHASTKIQGYGSLTTICKSGAAGIFVKEKTLTITNLTLEASGKWGIAGWDGTQNEKLILDNAKVTATGTEAGIADLASFTTARCNMVEPAGGTFDETKHAVIDAAGNKAKVVKIVPTEYNFYINGTQVTAANCNDLSKIKGVEVAKGGEFKYNPDTKTLTMKDVKVQAEAGKNAIYNKGIEGLKIVVSGTNHLEAEGNFPSLSMQLPTFIEGSGTLEVTSSASAGIYVKETTLTISDITLAASGNWGITGWDGMPNEKLILNNAKVTATGTEAGIANLDSFTINSCKMLEPAGGKFDEAKRAVVDAEGNVAKLVKVETIPVTGVTVTPKTVDLTVGKTQQLSISVQPTTASNQRYTCQSDNASVATVTNAGLITAVSVGTANITVTTEDGNKTETCKVTVSQSTSPDVPDGVEDALLAHISVAPNPFLSQLQIVHGELQGTYALLNTQGVVVLSGELGEAHTYLSTSALPAGLYLLRLTATNGATKTVKVVKDR